MITSAQEALAVEAISSLYDQLYAAMSFIDEASAAPSSWVDALKKGLNAAANLELFATEDAREAARNTLSGYGTLLDGLKEDSLERVRDGRLTWSAWVTEAKRISDGIAYTVGLTPEWNLADVLRNAGAETVTEAAEVAKQALSSGISTVTIVVGLGLLFLVAKALK